MRDGGAAQSNLLQVLLSVFNALADRVRNFAGLADAKAYDAVAVTDNNKSGKLKDTAPLTVLETRLIATTRSFRSSVDASIFIAKTIFLLLRS